MSGSERLYLVVVAAFSLLIRLAYLLSVRDSIFFNHPRLDALFHDTWAVSIASGNSVGGQVFFRAPLYPYVLALVYALCGHDYLAPRIFQHVLGACVPVLVYLLAARLFDRRSAVIASLLASTYAILVYFEGELLLESILPFMVAVWAWSLMRCTDTENRIRWAATGMLYGLICITRPPFVALIPVVVMGIFFWLLPASQTSYRRSAAMLFLVGSLVPVVLITARNGVAGGEYVVIASQGGINFYIGNNELADGYTSSLPEAGGRFWEGKGATYQAARALGHDPTPSEESRYWYGRGLAFIMRSPQRAIALFAKKVYLFLNHRELSNNSSFEEVCTSGGVPGVLPTGFWLVGPLALLGMILSVRNTRVRFYLTLLGGYTVITALFFVCDRFRAPLIPIFAVFAGYGVNEGVRRCRRRSGRQTVMVLLTLVLSSLLVNLDVLDLPPSNAGRRDFQEGLILLQEGNWEGAKKALERARESAPGLSSVRAAIGIAEMSLGNTTAARSLFSEELSLNPDSYGPLANLALLNLDLHRPDSCLVYGNAAMLLKPYHPSAYISSARAWIMKGDLARAESVLVDGNRACRGNFVYGQYLLGGILMSRRETTRAGALYRSALQQLVGFRQPDYAPESDFSVGPSSREERKSLTGKILYGLGHVATARGMNDTAVSYFRLAVSQSPEYADAWADLGVSLLRADSLVQAREALVSALRIDPVNAVYLYNLAVVYATEGAYDSARTVIDRCLLINPEIPGANTLRSRLLSLDGR